MIITEHDRAEWARMAVDCRAHRLNFLAGQISSIAELPVGSDVPDVVADMLKKLHHTWVTNGVYAIPQKGGKKS